MITKSATRVVLTERATFAQGRFGIRGLAVFGHPSILFLVPLSVREAAPNFGLTDPVFLPPFS
ncbi:hypothetical protein IVB11_01970 [Bradyrhizobium sp. 177]|uniref:hypothetical protein n=1 Tax=Bradyrhizobium sp. 177 TaxID=2782647 RepID=UPI001FF9AB47|nr:hypothetical protein [Bradyrhizobium sp. 177]MCK1547848.1 hypothetical protein [Bradyrhizobium sp. 177]